MNSRHFLDIDKFDSTDLRAILDQASKLKVQGRHARTLLPYCKDAVLIMIFEKPSTRTRVSFDVAMRQLGGEAISLNSDDMQLGRGETIADTARVLSRYCDIIMLRTNEHSNLEELSRYSDVPVINGLTNLSHPCQIMADIMTFEEKIGLIENRAVAWIGDGNNVAVSWIHAAVVLGFELRLGIPEGLEPDHEVLDWVKRSDAKIVLTNDPVEAVKGADCIVTDVWVSMGQTGEQRRRELLAPFQVDNALMSHADPDAIFMHCLPAHRGEEVTSEVIDGPQSVVFDEAENRLHIQKSILAWCLETA